eukprot:GHRR01015921.1.p1 GENE.GHRR01015921.1~~GHRR01015921.1.p1  ORF type:complete len:299 (+),score=102.56 GHRR01015921.1:1230-2126(+)
MSLLSNWIDLTVPPLLARCGTAALVSFMFGALGEPGSITNLPAALAGIACLLTGIALIAWASGLQRKIAAAAECQQQLPQTIEADQSNNSATADQHTEQHTAPHTMPELTELLLGNNTQYPRDSASNGLQQCLGRNRNSRSPSATMLAGILLALLTGVFGGLILAPMDYVSYECRGPPYQAGVALGVLMAAPLVTYLVHWMQQRKVTSNLPVQLKAAALPGILAGIIWTAGIVANMLATQSIGLAIAYPVMQAGLFVAGLWGIVLYSELYSLSPHLVYWTGGVVVVSGAALIARSGPA